MFIPLINRPTRLTSHSATLIDNIFTNCFSQNGVNRIILNEISDHLPVCANSSTKTLACEKGIKFYKRNYSEINITKFQSKLSRVDWSIVMAGQDPNELYAERLKFETLNDNFFTFCLLKLFSEVRNSANFMEILLPQTYDIHIMKVANFLPEYISYF